jgi:hypothetical protein
MVPVVRMVHEGMIFSVIVIDLQCLTDFPDGEELAIIL